MKERKKSTYTIYSLMNEIETLRVYVKCAFTSYQKRASYYSIFEDQARASLDTLLDVKYINRTEYKELYEQLFHVFRMYKRH